jgi:CRP/FNR family transcriptional regulator, anaerobic regulatory protein
MRQEVTAAATQVASILVTRHGIGPLPSICKCVDCDARPHTVCGAFAIPDLRRLAAIAVTMRMQPGRPFIQEGDPAEHFFNVTSGTAKVFKLLPDGRRMITGFAGRGHFLGLAVSTTYAFSAQAVDAVSLCRYSRPLLKALLREFPVVEQRLLEVATSELVAAQEQMLLLGRKTARERLASFLLARVPIGERASGGAAVVAFAVALPMTRGDIADYLGLSLETVSRTMTGLKGEGLIAVPTPWRIVIRDHAALTRLAAGEH